MYVPLASKIPRLRSRIFPPFSLRKRLSRLQVCANLDFSGGGGWPWPERKCLGDDINQSIKIRYYYIIKRWMEDKEKKQGRKEEFTFYSILFIYNIKRKKRWMQFQFQFQFQFNLFIFMYCTLLCFEYNCLLPSFHSIPF